MLEKKDIENNFKQHEITESINNKMIKIRELALNFAKEISELCPDSREKSLAFTKLEEVMFWANAAISRYNEE